MWSIAEGLFFMLILLVSVTEFFIPLLFNKPFFGSFRKAKPVEPKAPVKPEDLKSKVEEAKKKVAEVKGVQDEVAAFHKSATDLKDESENLTK